MPLKKKLEFTEEKPQCLAMGIVSAVKDYRLCWMLNNAFEIQLIKIDNVVAKQPGKKKETQFARFAYTDMLTKSVFFVIQNKNAGAFCIPAIKKADYLFFIKGAYYLEHATQIYNTMHAIQEIQAVIQFECSSVKTVNDILSYDNETKRN